MKQTTQIINAYLNGELEECELINFQNEVQSNENLELKVSKEILKMMKDERAYRINETNNANGGISPSLKRMKRVKSYNPATCFLNLLQKNS